MDFACVLKSGGVYTQEWVRKLYSGVQSWVSDPVEFTCMSDMDVDLPGVRTIGLKCGWPGWWSKLELFGAFAGPVVYLDLDTLVVGPLDDLIGYDGPLAMLQDFYYPDRPASGVMAWSGDYSDVTEQAIREGVGPKVHRLDHWIEARVDPESIQDLFPGQVVSLKAHARDAIPDGARLVCGHGKPRFDQPAAGWAYEHWRAL